MLSVNFTLSVLDFNILYGRWGKRYPEMTKILRKAGEKGLIEEGDMLLLDVLTASLAQENVLGDDNVVGEVVEPATEEEQLASALKLSQEQERDRQEEEEMVRRAMELSLVGFEVEDKSV